VNRVGRMVMRGWCASVAVVLLAGTANPAAEQAKSAAERGREALLGQSFSPPIISPKAYDNLWKVWGLKAKPANYDQMIRERYGLHEAPYPNKGLPMGLREATGLLSKGFGNDCMLCHAGSIAGQSIVGLGNSALDLQALFDEFFAAQGMRQVSPIPFSNVRGTSEASASAAYLFQFRNDDLSLR